MHTLFGDIPEGGEDAVVVGVIRQQREAVEERQVVAANAPATLPYAFSTTRSTAWLPMANGVSCVMPLAIIPAI
jgi:hypothetical protein